MSAKIAVECVSVCVLCLCECECERVGQGQFVPFLQHPK